MGDIQIAKIIVVGESNVGKTSMIQKYCWNKNEKSISPTIGSDYTYKVIQRRHKQLKLQIWDTAGQEKFQSVSKLLFKKTLGCIIVSDITEETSLIHSLNWKNLVQSHSDQLDQLPIFLVQNKLDQIKGNELKPFQKPDYLQEFSNLNGFTKHYQISAKNTDVSNVFEDLVDEMLSRKIVTLGDQNTSFSLSKHQATSPTGSKDKTKSCC